MSGIITPYSGKSNAPICGHCSNHGYYEVGMADKEETTQMFCFCEAGATLREVDYCHLCGEEIDKWRGHTGERDEITGKWKSKHIFCPIKK